VNLIVFERSSGGVRPTTAARDLLRTAQSILEQMDTLVTGTHSAGRGEVGRLAFDSLSAGNLRATLLEYKERLPQIEIDLIERSRTRLTVDLLNGAIDVVIATGESPLHDSKVMRLWNERIVVTLRQRIDWRDAPLGSHDRSP
jgi:DNA-binding transcriptional LysR family regulator